MRSGRVGVGPDVKLSEGRGRSIGLRVKTRRGSGLSVARGEGVVAVVSRHDELAAHDVQFVLALKRGRDGGGLGSTNSDTELIVRHKAHPLLVENILSADVRSDVASDRVTQILRSVGVQLTPGVSVRDVDLSPVKVALHLYVQRRFYEVNRLQRPIGNQTRSVPVLSTVSDGNGLDVSDERVGSGLGRSEEAEVVDGVDCHQS